jgi:lysophospholipase L1-like esterase
LELIIFRFILVAPDLPRLDFVDGVLKYKPDQHGVYRIKNEIKSKYKINRNGWNSKYDQYKIKKSDNKFRIAVIGDSYVEALQVNYDESLAEQLEQISDPGHLEVYRFAISGAPLSQYLHILRSEVWKYSPDLVVIVLVHNDFDESYLPTHGVYTKSFLKINVTNEKLHGEIPPAKYEKPWYAIIRNSAAWRYLTYRQQIHFSILRKIVFRETEQKRVKHPANSRNLRYEANIEVSGLDARMVRNKLVTEYIFRKMSDFCRQKNSKLLIIIDGVRNSIYRDPGKVISEPKGALSLNAMARSVAKKYGIDFIDLQPVFKQDFMINNRRFNFKHDGHWNIYGHQVVAHAIGDFINKLLTFKEPKLAGR